jgi:hypothetical protein
MMPWVPPRTSTDFGHITLTLYEEADDAVRAGDHYAIMASFASLSWKKR